MSEPSTLLRSTARGLAILILATLTACSAIGTQQKDLTEAPIITPIAIDEAKLLELLNAYRSQNSLPALTIDQTLNAVSSDMARHIAKRDSLKTWAHSVFGLSQRLEKAGYANYAAAENLGAGYTSLEAAFEGWQGSDGHNKNLLNPYVTRVGTGRMLRSDGTWRNFWVLTLARPKADGRPTPR